MNIHGAKYRCILALGAAILTLSGCDGNSSSSTTKCSAGQHIAEDSTCAQNTAERCGKHDSTHTVDCNTHNHATVGTCSGDGECVAIACKDGYRLSQGRCIEDNLSTCSAVDDCEELPGWVGGTCDDGRCLATRCATGYCLQNDVCTDGKSNVIACGIMGGEQICQDCSTEGAERRCADGECVKATCAPTVCYYEGNECLNADTHCGRECLNCHTANNASAGTCDQNTGTCTITACKADHHLNEDQTQCVPDTVAACGAHDNNCANLPGWVAGECVEGDCYAIACADGYHRWSQEVSYEGGNDKCVQDNIYYCGSELMRCVSALPGWRDGSCTDGQCVMTRCPEYFCVENNMCVDGTSDREVCGLDGLACKSCMVEGEDCVQGECVKVDCYVDEDCPLLRGMAEALCWRGKCAAKNCEEGYRAREGVCKADCHNGNAICGGNEVCDWGARECRCASRECSASQRCCLIKGTPTNICVDEEEVGSDTFACPYG